MITLFMTIAQAGKVNRNTLLEKERNGNKSLEIVQSFVSITTFLKNALTVQKTVSHVIAQAVN